MSILRDHRLRRLHQSGYPLDYEDPDEDFLPLEAEMLLLLMMEYLSSQPSFRQWIQDQYPELECLLQTDEHTSD